jgi:hypothetical protein
VLVELPFKVEYSTPGNVPIEEVIDSLISIRTFLEETGPNLSTLVPGLSIDDVNIKVRSITHESPLRELFFLTLFVSFQDDLNKSVPEAIEFLIKQDVPDKFHGLITIITMMLIFYGAGYVKDVVGGLSADSAVKRQLNALIAEIAVRTGNSEEKVRELLDKRYKPGNRMRELASAAVKFFKPSKSQGNAEIEIAGRRISSDLIADVPAEYAYKEAEKSEISRSFSDVDLDIYAQDREKDKSGWAAVPQGIGNKRLKMKLLDGVTPDQLWNKDKVIGDIVVKYNRVGIDLIPAEIHLIRVRD